MRLVGREEETKLIFDGAKIDGMERTQTRVSNVIYEGLGAGWNLSAKEGNEEELGGKGSTRRRQDGVDVGSRVQSESESRWE